MRSSSKSGGISSASNPTERVLLPYQQAWIKDISSVKVIEKSRRVGISWAEAADDALYTADPKFGQDVWYVGYNADMAREYIDDVAAWSRHYHLAAGSVEQEVLKEDKDILSFSVSFASGHKIKALSSRPANFRGKQGRAVIDEASFHPDLDELIKAAMAMLVWGGSVRIISTHDGDDNPFNDLITDCRKGKKNYSVHRVTFMEAVEQGLFKRICLTKGETWSAEKETAWIKGIYDHYGDHAAEELDVIPSSGSGVWLPRALIEKRMTPCNLIEIRE